MIAQRAVRRQVAMMMLTTLVAGCGLELLLPTNAGPIVDGTGPGADKVYELAGQRFRVETVVENLEIPWAIAFCDCGGFLYFTERPGRLSVFNLSTRRMVLVAELTDVAPPIPRSERGLMGLALSPNWSRDHTLFVSYTSEAADGSVRNIIEPWIVAGDRIERGGGPIVANLPAAFVHEGLGLGFGPDGKLYASTGDALQAARAQDLDYLGGKFLRFNPDGSIPDDNPFPGSPVWSLGHRNPQGFAWHPERPDVLMATEHGSSFLLDGTGGEDEINLIRPRANYGWPLYRRDATAPGFEAPLWNSGDESIAPAGATFCTGRKFPAWKNALLFATLRGASLFVIRFDPNDPTRIVSVDRGLQGEFGRLRAIREAPDGSIYLSTSNRDGRGTPAVADDRILRLVPVE